MKYLNIYNGIMYTCNYIMDMYLYNYISMQKLYNKYPVSQQARFNKC